ncbi:MULTISPECIES: octaprenyl diphosphate synthase [Alteromonas]|jgi:octaprenyl-diphosphate synthase|uniref:Octaprenyl diphosphate synthase n=1 Tax=Alteromonas mediterranea TaxID=314275 RepID=A0AAC8XHD3_9ALTE|nr:MULTISPECIES: octaprenyl diphosphate synthase [Alteromonas]MEA3382924.1 octaprenyl diphosphate synthase [Pseudomonadota bacterium]AFV84120.1 geranylgeranyl pyrophosphate synthase [Alteromonas mediterranea DE1]AGP80558.1 geranylgeranyl pyrophosphate synthase [Alteromonas mediterranea MED64]AGP96128.1 geranylgeranyl pyrophosphate synthase [Alteromonas mediterranea UM7]AGQ00461.1 geranylgeranyl pyrophosphate synthase [Alteromonas mediterranea UM4b]|tara:strand:+ start:37 stop:1011 length:975 start_codon:yes stop_codon:yes gene_type:complete
MDIDQIRALSNDDMQAVNQLIQQQVDSEVALINQLGFYIVNSGGKRLRPLLTVLSARAMGIDNNEHHTLAAIVEFIHTATLLHDDVVDESTMRRGRETANAIFGNQASVLVGDFLYTRSFQMMVSLKRMRVMEILSEATNQIAEGEVLQLMNCNDAGTTEARYFDVIYGKTARLFEAATQLAAVLTEQNEHIERAMQEYGKHLGTAFQLADDILDYMADSEEMGKNAGDDLAEGKPTLPLLYAMWHATNDGDKALIQEAIEQSNGLPHLTRIQGIMEETGALDYTRQCAQKEVQMAIDSLSAIEDSKYKEALIALAHISIERTS